MSEYTWSICGPDNPDIEEKGPIQRDQILQTFQEYPWLEQASLQESLEPDQVHLSPSIRFTRETGVRSLELSLYDWHSGLEFYLWYERPVTRKSFFGLFGEREGIEVIDKRPFSKEQAAEILTFFIDEIETRMA